MSSPGVSSTNLPTVTSADEVIVNANGDTARMSVPALFTQGASDGPLGQDIADLTQQVAAANAHAGRLDNPHSVTAAQIGALSQADADARFEPLEAGQASGSIVAGTWVRLLGLSGSVDGTPGEVLDTDGGTHLQATDQGYDGASVPNAGRYNWREDWGRWEWIGETGYTGLGFDLTQSLNERILLHPAFLNGAEIAWAVTSPEAGYSAIYCTTDGTLTAPKLSNFATPEGVEFYGLSALAQVLDNAGNPLLYRLSDGTSTAPGIPRLIPDQMYCQGRAVIAGFVNASDQQMPLGILADGTVKIPKLDARETLIAQGILPRDTLVGLGDSIMAAGFLDYLGARLNKPVLKNAIGGQVSEQIAMRFGAAALTCRLANNAMAAGSNEITHWNGTAISAASMDAMPLSTHSTLYNGATLRARIAGVLGTVTRTVVSSAETYSFTPDEAETLPSHVPPDSGVQVDVADQHASCLIMWLGRNDASQDDWSDSDVEDYTLACVNRLSTGVKKFVILGPLNGQYETEHLDGSRYPNLIARTAKLIELFPSNFIDIRRALIDRGFDIAIAQGWLPDDGSYPTAQDTTDISDDVVPVSFRADDIHPNEIGEQIVAYVVAEFITSKGWFS